MRSKSAILKHLVIIAASLLVAGPLFLFTPQAPHSQASADSTESINIQWKRAIAEPICLTMTQDGKFFGSVDKSGNVQFFDAKGSLLWKKQVEGATDILIARNGQSVLVYSKLNPVYEDVYFFRNNGTRLWKQHVEGPIWAGAVSTDGSYAAVTTGKQFIYVYSPDPKHPKYRRWRLDGIGHIATFTPDNEHVIIGTWQNSGLVCYGRGGELKWHTRNSTDRQYDLRISADGKTILGMIPGRFLSPHIELRLWNSDGKSIWMQTLDGYDGHCLVSPTSQYIALSYADIISHKSSEIIERKVAVYKTDGELLWEKGGLFFGPRLVALSPKGSSVIVWDGAKSLYNIDRSGRILSKLILGGKVRKALPTEDGRKVIIYCGDGWMYLLNVS